LAQVAQGEAQLPVCIRYRALSRRAPQNMARPMRLLAAACLVQVAAGKARAGSQSVFARLQALTQSAPADASQALRELDTNQDGQVELNEVSSFAIAKGLDYAATVKEFASFDANHDGKLNAAELAGALGLPPPAPPATPAETRPRTSALASRIATLLSRAPSAKSGVTSSLSNEESFMQRAAAVSAMGNQLALEVSRGQEALDLERKAAEARAQLTVLQVHTAERAQEASAAAAKAMAEQLAQNLTSLEGEALRAEVRAAALRAKMEADIKQVSDLSSIVKVGLAAVHGA